MPPRVRCRIQRVTRAPRRRGARHNAADPAPQSAVMPDIMRTQLVHLLRGEDAHMTFDEAVADFPAWAINERAPNVEYTPWHLVEHVRLTQWDMLHYIEDP